MKNVLALIVLSLFLISCGGAGRSVTGSGSSSVVLDLGQRETVSSSSAMLFSQSSVGASSSNVLPATVASVRVTVTDGEGGDVLVDTTVDVTGRSSVQIEVNVPNGSNRVFTVYAYCSLGDLLYQGSTTADLNGNSVSISVTMTSVSNVSVSGSWTHPSDLSDNISPSGMSVDSKSPQVAMDNNGNTIIVWSQPDSYEINRVFKSEYRSGSWSHPASLTDGISPSSTAATSPHVAMDNNGNAIIVWYQLDSGGYRIMKSEYRSGSWTHPSSLSESISVDGYSAYSPRVAMDNNGNAIIVWYQSDSDTKNQIFKSEYRSGSWTHPSAISDNISPDGQHAYRPSVAMDDNGNAIIAWHQNGGTYNQIYKSEYRSGSWSHPSALSSKISPDGMTAVNAEVAMDNNGNALITWYQNAGSGYNQIYLSEYRSGSWTHPSDINDNISPDSASAFYPQAAMDNSGNALIVWQQGQYSDSQIYKSEYRSGSWSHPSSLTDNISPDGAEAQYPYPAMDNDGNAIITWNQVGAGYMRIFKSEYRSGSWTHPSGLSDYISPYEAEAYPDAYKPFAAMDDNGNAVIAWYQYAGSTYQIFKSDYR